MGLPALFFGVAMDDGPYAASPVYTDLSDRVRTFKIDRGRSYILDADKMGVLTMRLDCNDGALDAEWSGSPYYGKFTVRRPVYFGFYLGGVLCPLFKGVIRKKPLVFPSIKTCEVQLEAADPRLLLGDARRSKTYEAALSGTRLAEIADDAGLPGTGLGSPGDSHRDIDTGGFTMAEETIENRPLLEHLEQVAMSEGGRVFFTAGGALRHIDQRSLLSDAVYTEPQAVFGDDGSELPYRSITISDDDEQYYSEARLTNTSGDEVFVEDAATSEEYGAATLTRSELLLETESELEDLGYYLLNRHKPNVQRIPAIELPMSGQGDQFPGLWNVIASYDLATRFEVRKRPGGRYLKSQEVNLEGLTHEGDYQKGTWRTVLRLWPADPVPYWRLKTRGVFGTSTILGR